MVEHRRGPRAVKAPPATGRRRASGVYCSSRSSGTSTSSPHGCVGVELQLLERRLRLALLSQEAREFLVRLALLELDGGRRDCDTLATFAPPGSKRPRLTACHHRHRFLQPKWTQQGEIG